MTNKTSATKAFNLKIASQSTTLPMMAYLRENQVLALLPISKSTLWRMVAAKKLKTLKISARVTLFSTQSLQEYLSACEKA